MWIKAVNQHFPIELNKNFWKNIMHHLKNSGKGIFTSIND